MPATGKNFKQLLRRGSVAVVVGGIAEMYMQVGAKRGKEMQVGGGEGRQLARFQQRARQAADRGSSTLSARCFWRCTE